MTRLPCQYAIIRFLPYAETGEFANVGVLLACPASGYFAARLMPTKRTGRITGFFEQLDARIYRESLKYLRDELERVQQAAQQGTGPQRPVMIQQLFADLTRPREGLLRFGDIRVVLAEDPEAMLERLFARFVERDFASKEYHDQLLIRGVREVLTKANLRQYFKPEEIGNDYVHVQVPFVHVRDGAPALAIKPLGLDKDDPNQVLDHGGHWVERVHRLRRHGLLPAEMLFAVKKPVAGNAKASKAADEIVDDLRNAGMEVALATDTRTITEFAKAVLH